ncbi:MAG: M20/M25/M40 family metallo-hydrolase [Ignavibacteriales bacterium]
MSKILDDYFKPEAVHYHFIELTKLYHPSGEEDSIREYIMQFAKKMEGVEVTYYDPDAKNPGKRVIVLRRKGSGRYLSSPYITLQAHMDMVCSPHKKIFPLNVFGYTDENGVKWIKAGDKESIFYPEKGTTLGADDGIGLATILAILEDNKLKDYPIECLFTVQEEAEMIGAAGFNKNLLKGRTYINLDAENAKTIIYGSAGGCRTKYKGNVNLLPIPSDFIALKLSISGLPGGHSGVNINNGKLNPIKILSEAIIRLNNRLTKLDSMFKGIKSYNLRLISMKRDEEPNLYKIPGCASAIIALSGNDDVEFESNFKAYCEALRVQYQVEKSEFVFNVEKANFIQNSLDEASTDTLLCLLRQIPHGVIRMIPTLPTLVETSSNLANINIKPKEGSLTEGTVEINITNRSSDFESMKALINVQKTIGELYRYTVETSNPFPSWEPNDNSVLLNKAKDVYKKIYGNEFKATVIHAGLECSYVVQKYNNEIDCISIGPTIMNPHTGGESLKTATVEQLYKAVTYLIQSLFVNL